MQEPKQMLATLEQACEVKRMTSIAEATHNLTHLTYDHNSSSAAEFIGEFNDAIHRLERLGIRYEEIAKIGFFLQACRSHASHILTTLQARDPTGSSLQLEDVTPWYNAF